MRLFILIGHRGVGKTTFFRRNSNLFSVTFDLDSEIESRKGLSIEDIFSQYGESEFRKFEIEIFEKLCHESALSETALICVGAGFNPSNLPESAQVIWLRRASDSDGRIFLNRPRLDGQVSALEESRDKWISRSPQFEKRADFIFDMPEGDPAWSKRYQEFEIGLLEGLIFERPCVHKAVWITLQPWHLTLSRWKTFQLFSNLTIEVRSDIIDLSTFDVISSLSKEIKNAINWVFSIRSKIDLLEVESRLREISLEWKIDCDEEFMNPTLKSWISNTSDSMQLMSLWALSSHTKEPPRQNSQVKILKWAPICSNWHDLMMGILWQRASPEVRYFLPRSPNGRWDWYRLHHWQRDHFNFLHFGLSSANDQPKLWQVVLSTNIGDNALNGVIGSPVKHSWSPLFHMDFFAHKNFFSIDIERQESDAWSVLKDLGLSCAAITSPLKNLVSKWSDAGHRFENSVVNTYMSQKDQDHFYLTDLEALREWFKDLRIQAQKVVLWGNGALSSEIQNLFPDISVYSARTGELIQGSDPSSGLSIALIWGTPSESGIVDPPKLWRIEQVIDLNYRDNSLGIDLAQKRGINYVSGKSFFIRQAQKQQQIWSSLVIGK